MKKNYIENKHNNVSNILKALKIETSEKVTVSVDNRIKANRNIIRMTFEPYKNEFQSSKELSAFIGYLETYRALKIELKTGGKNVKKRIKADYPNMNEVENLHVSNVISGIISAGIYQIEHHDFNNFSTAPFVEFIDSMASDDEKERNNACNVLASELMAMLNISMKLADFLSHVWVPIRITGATKTEKEFSVIEVLATVFVVMLDETGRLSMKTVKNFSFQEVTKAVTFFNENEIARDLGGLKTDCLIIGLETTDKDNDYNKLLKKFTRMNRKLYVKIPSDVMYIEFGAYSDRAIEVKKDKKATKKTTKKTGTKKATKKTEETKTEETK